MRLTLRWIFLSLVVLLGAAAVGRAGDSMWLGRFSTGVVSAWEEHTFSGKTAYRLRDTGQETALFADSRGTASAFYHERRIDLRDTPTLRWRWRVDNGPSGLSERTRDGDDYAARVYVVHKRGLFRAPYAMNYVWSGSQTRGTTWPNAWLPEHSAMVAVRGTGDTHRQWFSEQRDVRADFKQYLGMDVTHVDVIVLMTDTDNQQGEAQAWYGDIHIDVK